MTHPATTRAATTFLEALGAPIDVGLVFPPRDGEQRGRGVWYAHNVEGARELAPLLGRAAAANVAGAAVYARVHGAGIEPGAPHAGVVLVDDLDADGIRRLEVDGLSPSVVVETSPANFQGWVRLAAYGQMSRHDAIAAARELATRYGGDLKAVAACQPGRLPGFTNRKPKHQQKGIFPFVRLRDARPGLIGPGAVALLRHIRDGSALVAQPAHARGAPETPLAASDGADWSTLDAIRVAQKARIEAEVASGRRPVASATASEIDFAVAVQALRDGASPRDVEAWLAVRRSDHHAGYAARTVANAARHVSDRPHSASQATVARPA